MSGLLSRRDFLLTAAATGCVPAAYAAEPPRVLHLVSAALPPYVFEPGHAAGAGLDIDIAREALQRGGGWTVRVSVLPWRRALLMLEHGQADFAPSVRITAERRRFLNFSRPYGGHVRPAIYTRVGSEQVVKRLADLHGLSVGLAAGFELPPALQSAITGPIERATDASAVLRMLLAKRVQAVVLNELPAQWLVRESGWGAQVQAQPLVFDSGDETQMAFSLRSPWLSEGLAAANRGLESMARDKRFAQLASRYRMP